MLSSGCREGVELRRGWDLLCREAREAAAWLDSDVEQVFTVPVAGIGQGSVTGKTRGDYYPHEASQQNSEHQNKATSLVLKD